jgi:hypothetical protein
LSNEQPYIAEGVLSKSNFKDWDVNANPFLALSATVTCREGTKKIKKQCGGS